MKGALHVHSTYSDGEFTLAELRQIYLDQSCSFVCITDHAEYFDAERLARYTGECRTLSDENFLFVSGLEYSCENNMHVLGYGATHLSDSKDPEKVIGHIGQQGAIPVIAHPKNEFFEWIETFRTLPQGIETWNSKYDGRYAPRPETFALLQRLRQRKPEMHAFYGQDLHWKNQFRELFVEINAAATTREEILQALASGAYSGLKGELLLPSSGVLEETLIAQFGRAHGLSNRMWQYFKRSKQILDRLGIGVPESVKAQLRRIF